MKTESWCGHNIRFVEIDGEWWVIINDVCEALDRYEGFVVKDILDDDLIKRIRIEDEYYLVTNEIGIYKIIFESDIIEARRFRRWSATVMQKLRTKVGLEPYEAMRMMEPEIQDDIDHILDTLFYDEETGTLMQSITVAGGDVEQVEFL